MRLIIHLKPVIQSCCLTAVIMYTVERIPEIQSVAIFVSTGINGIIIRHHVISEEKPVPDTYIPVGDIKVQFSSSREDIMSDIDPVMLHGLNPAESHIELLEFKHPAELETHIWIDQDIVYHSPCLFGTCKMIHIS